MKKVKIKFVGYWPEMKPESQHIFRILCRYYDVEICEDPDYIICSCFAPYYAYCKYPQIRIMSCGENYIPDFNLIDYGICNYPIQFQDRCFYKPGCFDSFGHALALEGYNYDRGNDFLQEKEFFANFIASHDSEYGIRSGFLKELSLYKHVESPGTFLNNMSDHKTVNWTDSSKTDFQKRCKFTICFESTKHEGFLTEKITDAFFSETIPIYYGSSTVKEIFNPKAFIDISDFETWNEAIEYIKMIDQNDQLYLDMINQPALINHHYFRELNALLEDYILHIFEQPIEAARRRSQVYSPKKHELFLNEMQEKNINRLPGMGLLKKEATRMSEKIRMKLSSLHR